MSPADPSPAEPRAVQSRLTRRHALGGVATVGLALPLLSACGGDDSSTATDPATGGGSPSTRPGSGGSGGGSAASGFATTSEVPVGSGAVFPDEGVVVTQPTEGEFLGFSITCTHQGCPVESVSESGIVCPCHSSVFDVATGEPTAGPATAPLSSIELAVDGDSISRA